MRPRRRAAVASAAGVLLALSGCGILEAPTPFVTVYSSGTSENAEAMAYCHEEGVTLPEDITGQLPEGCVRYDREPIPLEVEPGGDVAIDVDQEFAESGWTINDSQQVLEVLYQSLPVPEDFAQPIRFDVVQLVDGDPTKRRGIWTFELQPKTP